VTRVEELAQFAAVASYDQLSDAACEALRIRILDSLGCAIGALGAEPMRRVRSQVEELGPGAGCTLVGGGSAAPDRAALVNGALVRYLDFNDTYFARHETCHPSDNLGAVLAAVEYRGGTGRELLAALATAYQVQCRLSDEAPVRARGFDHTAQGAYAASAGICRGLGLGAKETANAIAICGTAFNALRVTRTGRLSNWKGLAYPHLASCCMNAAFLAKHGITGPPEVIEGEKGFMATISGQFDIDWSREDLEKVRDTVLKRHNAEAHSQTAIEAILQLRRERGIRAEDVERIDLTVFGVAYRIIGGGEEGDKTLVATKEEADHSLPYLVAVALLDGQVMPPQFAPERVRRPDVQELLRRVRVHPSKEFSSRFPDALPCRVTVALRDGHQFTLELDSYPGFTRRPASWRTAVEKFERLAGPFAGPELRCAIAEAVADVEERKVADLMGLLALVRAPLLPGREGGEGWRREPEEASGPSRS